MTGGISRRAVLAGGVAVGLAACTSTSTSPDGSAEEDRTTTSAPEGSAGRSAIVVGAGLAGLTTALDLVERGWDVTVLEARNRVGGRVHTVRGEAFTGGLHAEAGGESIDTDHTAMLKMLARFDLQTEARPANKILDGLTTFQGFRGQTKQFVGLHDAKVGEDYERYYEALDELAVDVDPLHPEDHPKAHEWDQTSLAEWVDTLDLVPEARFLVDADNRGEFNAEPTDISLLFVAQQWAVGTDIADSGVEAMRVHGGNDRLPEAMADELGDIVVLEAPVTKVVHGESGVTVTAGGEQHEADWLVLACPFVPLRRVAFSPALPDEVAGAIGGLDLGPAAKVIVQYRERFWADDDAGELSGFTVSDQPFGIAWSPTDSYGDPDGPGLLTAFIAGDAAEAAAAQSDADRIAAVRQQFAEVYPDSVAQDAKHQATAAWANERYTGGGYAVPHPGQMAAFWPVIRSGTGRIRFAGEHTEPLAGYMESAIRSGHRIAEELDGS